MSDLEKSFGSINLEKSLGDDIEDFYEKISMPSDRVSAKLNRVTENGTQSQF